MEILHDIYKSDLVKKSIYFLITMKIRYFDVLQVGKMLNVEGYNKSILKATDTIKQTLDKHVGGLDKVTNYLNKLEPYHYYLYKEDIADISTIILCYLIKYFDYKDIFSVPLEVIPETGENRYKLTNIEGESGFNHEGIMFNNTFYYYNPLLLDGITGDEPPMLLKELFKLNEGYNKLAIRLDKTISVNREEYKKKFISFSELYMGKIINLDKITFPLYKGNNKSLCVYNPRTMKKIQFKISNRRDLEKWIEVEELWYINEKSKKNVIVTRYLHSIYDPEKDLFTHIDGSLNFYNKSNYIVRQSQTINAHADSHYKLWLIEGQIGIVEWGKLILEFFKDYDLIFDAFEGRAVEEIFNGII